MLYDFDAASAPTLVDFTVTHPTAPSYLNHAYGGVGAAAASKERAKVSKYMQLATLRGFDFAPFGLESYGAWGPAANESLRRLCKHASSGGRTDTRAAVGWCAPHIAEVARQWVSVALQRGNGRLLLDASAARYSRADVQRASARLVDDDEDEDDEVAAGTGPAVRALVVGVL